MDSEFAMSKKGERSTTIRAAEYVRMSTEHQQYSTVNQNEKIRDYAAQRGIEVVKTYADEGKSGLRIDGRLALQQLIKEVQQGEADFSLILVYDVSRWGRFQDADESAYYEYICKRAGIQVAYCAEQFENDGSPVSTIVKGVKRAMAGEYSRELSAKVFACQCKLIEMGYRQGGPAGYGLRRVMIDQTGQDKGQLRRGEQKSLQTDRVILSPGPDHEVKTVREIYDWFINDGIAEIEVARRLNAAGIKNEVGLEWTRATVHQVLTNEKYVGNNVYNRRSFKLKKLRVANTPEMWIRREDAFEPVVSREIFYTAQGIMRARSHKFSREDLIERLRGLYHLKGYLSAIVIDEAEGMPSSVVYRNRFGSLIQAYQLVGFDPVHDYQYVEVNRFLRGLYPKIVAQAEANVAEVSGKLSRFASTDVLNVNQEFSVSIVLVRCRKGRDGKVGWKVRFDNGPAPDITIAIRLDPANENPLDYYLLPQLGFGRQHLSLKEQNAIEVESFRFDSLDYFYAMAARTSLRHAT